METPFVEVKSALWQKIFASVVALPFIGAGLVCWISPWVPTFSGPAPHPALAFAVGLALGGFFFCFLWWPVMRYRIRADSEGLEQFNGFFRQSVRWSQVESYYLEQNSRFYAERHHYVEPVLLDANGAIIFRGFAHILKSTRAILQERHDLWQFVEAQLAGKRMETPFKPDVTKLAVESLNFDWSKKGWAWKTARLFALVCYVLIGMAVGLLPSYYVVSNDIHPSTLGVLLIMLALFVPLIPHLIWFEFKKRRIRRELEEHDNR